MSSLPDISASYPVDVLRKQVILTARELTTFILIFGTIANRSCGIEEKLIKE